MAERYVYDFDEPTRGGRELLGGKGIGLAEMTRLGVPVPAGFTITTDACRAYMAGRGLPDGLEAEVDEHVRRLEARTGKRFGSSDDPLLVSVRSGAAVSMPGMMDTILNLGLNDAAAEGLGARTGNARFAFDSYRRLIQMFGEVVDGIDGHRFESALSSLKERRGAQHDTDLSADDLRELVETFKGIYLRRDRCRASRPTREPSCCGPCGRCSTRGTRRGRRSTGARTTSPTISGPRSTSCRWCSATRATARAPASRSPATRRPARPVSTASSWPNAQGEDVVAGIRTPQPIEAMRDVLPKAFDQLVETMRRLEENYRDMQDVEFTVEDEQLYLLQTRSAKRTAAAALKAAAAMVDEGLITREEAVGRIDPAQLDQLLHPMIDPSAALEVAAKGLNASPGAASGAIVFDADTAVERAKSGPVILVSLGDDARRHPRHDRRRGHPHGARRHDLARGRRRARDGQAVRRRLRRPLAGRRPRDDRRPRRCTRAT